MQDRIIRSFDDVEALFDEVSLALGDCVCKSGQREQESDRRLARLERAVAELAEGQRQLAGDLQDTRCEVRELQLRLDRLEQALRTEMDQLRSAAECRFTHLESLIDDFRQELKRHREEFRF